MANVDDVRFMREALAAAKKAAAAAEVPVGAVVVADGRVIARGRNRTEATGQAIAHAELEALRKASGAVGDWRLDGCTLYVTLEPCPMCAFAAVLSRVDRIVYGAADPKFGGCGSVVNVPARPFNHRVAVEGGILAEECSALLREFFRRRRE
ncbi:MAG: tRNA-specific adenosine deaminase [candidate division Zixibacteria bacterium]|nr:tRNA-specific adenosine deaminase [candidate division Zixibacteria bacterium]